MNSATHRNTAARTATTGATRTQTRRIVALATLMFGLGLVFVTGFANSATVHNAAHDTRHAMAFPCH